jgi:hypothetical protein
VKIKGTAPKGFIHERIAGSSCKHRNSMRLFSTMGSSFSTDINIVLEKVFFTNANGMTTDRCEMNELYYILKRCTRPVDSIWNLPGI